MQKCLNKNSSLKSFQEIIKDWQKKNAKDVKDIFSVISYKI